MIRRNTWILLVVFAALIGFAFYWRNHRAQEAAAATPTAVVGASAASKTLFSAAEGLPSEVQMQDSTGKSVDLARNETGVWVLKAQSGTPAAPANQGSSEAAATQVTALRVLSSVQLGFDIVGLSQPSYTLTVTFGDGKTRKLAIGALTPIQDGYYTSLDGGPVQIVDKQGLDALILLLTEPPYAMTLTPTVTPTASPAPATPTPAQELTGTPPPPASTGTPAATASAVTPTP